MSKRTVRLVTVRRRMTLLLLILMSIVIGTIMLSLSGKAYAKVAAVPFREILLLKQKLAEGPTSVPLIVALTMPLILNVLLFMPWGFLAFVFFDTPDRPAHQSYLLTYL